MFFTIKNLKEKYNEYSKKKNKKKYICNTLKNKTYLDVIYDEITNESNSKQIIKNDLGFDLKILKGTRIEEFLKDEKMNTIKKSLIENDFIVSKVEIIHFTEHKKEEKEYFNFFPNLKHSREFLNETIKSGILFIKDDIKYVFYLDNDKFYVNNGFKILSELSDKTSAILVYKKHFNGIYNFKGDLYCNIFYPLLIIV